MNTAPLTISVSSCLLGNKVRYDGGDRHNAYITDTLSLFFNIKPVCPEVEAGFTIPREAMHLYGNIVSPELVSLYTGKNLTKQMEQWCSAYIILHETETPRGFILKKNSPSCGLEQVPIKLENGMFENTGRGIFAEAVKTMFPLIPLIDEEDLSDARIRENFIEQVFCLDRLMSINNTGICKKDFLSFHAKHKLLVMAHSPDHYRLLGRLSASALPLPELLTLYATKFMDALKIIATPARHTNVLMHCLGYFKTILSPLQKKEIIEMIECYRTGKLPLAVPVKTLKHYLTQLHNPYLSEQYYFKPYPDGLMLRNQ